MYYVVKFSDSLQQYKGVSQLRTADGGVFGEEDEVVVGLNVQAKFEDKFYVGKISKISDKDPKLTATERAIKTPTEITKGKQV